MADAEAQQAALAAAITLIDLTIHPIVPKSVLTSQWIVFGLFILTAVLSSANIGLRLYRAYLYGTTFWVFRKVERLRGQYIIANNHHVWVLGSIFFSIAEAIGLYEHISAVETQNADRNVFVLTFLPMIISGTVSFAYTSSLLFSGLESAQSLSKKGRISTLSLPSPWVFHFFQFGLAGILAPTVFILSVVGNRTYQLAINHSQAAIDSYGAFTKNPALVTDAYLAAFGEQLSEAVYYLLRSTNFIVAMGALSIFWAGLLNVLGLPSILILIKGLRQAIMPTTPHIASGLSDAGMSTFHKQVRKGSKNDWSYRMKKQQNLLITFCLLATAYTTMLMISATNFIVLTRYFPDTLHEMQAANPGLYETVLTHYIHICFQLPIAGVLFYRAVTGDDENSANSQSKSTMGTLQVKMHHDTVVHNDMPDTFNLTSLGKSSEVDIEDEKMEKDFPRSQWA